MCSQGATLGSVIQTYVNTLVKHDFPPKIEIPSLDNISRIIIPKKEQLIIGDPIFAKSSNEYVSMRTLNHQINAMASKYAVTTNQLADALSLHWTMIADDPNATFQATPVDKKNIDHYLNSVSPMLRWYDPEQLKRNVKFVGFVEGIQELQQDFCVTLRSPGNSVANAFYKRNKNSLFYSIELVMSYENKSDVHYQPFVQSVPF